MDSRFTQYARPAAIITGIVSIIGFIALVLFFALEAPQITSGSNGFHFWGFLSDISGPASMIPLLIVIVALHEVERVRTPTWSRVALLLGVIGALGVTILQILLIIRVLSFEQEVGPVVLAMGIVGAWLVLANYLGRTQRILPSGLAWLGLAVGVAQVSYPVLLQLLGGADFYARLGNDLFLMMITAIIFLLSYIGFPVWLLWFARTWSGRHVKSSAGVAYAG